MAKVLPIFLALMFSFFSQCFAYYNTQYIPGKLIYSSYIIRFALYFLLLESPLYVRSFRKLHSIPESIFQFILGLFVIESALVYVWFPLENAILCVIPILSRTLYPYFQQSNFIQNILWYNMNVVQNNVIYLATSYFVSLTILGCVLHATRALNFELIGSCGMQCFLNDSVARIKVQFRKLVPKKRKGSRVCDSRPRRRGRPKRCS